MNLLKNISKHLFLFSVGAIVYSLIEIAWKSSHTTHWSMAVAGGLIFVLVGLLNEIYTYEMSLLFQGVYSGVLIATPIEYLFGLMFNQDFSIWDYRTLPGTILDQQCNIIFIFIWCVLCGLAVVIDDYLRYWLFNEEKPHYKLF